MKNQELEQRGPINTAEKAGGTDSHSQFLEILTKIEELGVTVSEWLQPTNYQKAKESFLECARHLLLTHESGQMSPMRPSFVYGKLDVAKIKANIARCRLLSLEIMYAQLSDMERKLVHYLFSEVYQKWRLLEAASDLDQFANLDNTISRQTVEARYRKFNAKVYGEPDEEIFLKLLNYQLGQLSQEDLDEADWEVRLELELRLVDLEVQDLNERLHPDQTPVYTPRASTVRAFSTLMKMWQRPLLKYLPQPKPTYSADEVAIMLERILDNEYPESKFGVEIDEERAIFSVDQIERRIKIPRRRARGDYDFADLEALILGHEWSHIVRGILYENAPIKMLSYGMPEYEAFDEGVAKCVENALRYKCGMEALGGIDHYVNIGLAYFGGRNFREVFEIRWRMFYLDDKTKGRSTRERREKAQELAFAQTARAFRGTGYLPNCKDLVYFNGSTQVWQYIESLGGDYPRLREELFETGKTDVTNKMHRLVLELNRKMTEEDQCWSVTTNETSGESY